MSLNLFYITNSPKVAKIAQKYGVNRIWIDLETIGKEDRQRGMNTVKSHHKISDIAKVKPVLSSSELMVRIDAWNSVTSPKQINKVIEAGADIIMLPMWKSVDEVKQFLNCVDHRVKTSLLLETKEAVECIDKVLKLDFDEIHIGLNDLHLSYGETFLFEPLANGLVEKLCKKFKKKGIPYGFGGIATLGQGLLPAEKIIMEHYRLGSTRSILSRSFCDTSKIKSLEEIEARFAFNMKALRSYELECYTADKRVLEANKKVIEKRTKLIVKYLNGELENEKEALQNLH